MNMVEANELRIGNSMKDINGEYFQICGNDIKTLQEIGMMIFQSNPPKPGYEPIPLTEEVLVKCGLDTDKAGDYKFQDLRLRLWKDNAWVLLNANGRDIYPGMPLIKYLHQLQNIIFYLTGKELNIKITIRE